MCGIHGFVVAKTKELNADDFLKNGFVAGMLRGTHSSGIASIDAKNEYSDIHKMPLPGMYFIDDRYTEQLIRAACDPSTITICHTRAATQGAVNARNAHPFRVSDWDENEGTMTREIVGVHNGSLTGWSTRTDAKGYQVDSEWALSHIFTDGYDAFEDFTGAYCFVWWDSDSPSILNIALNSERPMHVAFSKDGNMGYASEAGMLNWLFERNKITRDGDVRKLEPGTWYKFSLSDLKNPVKIKLPTAKTYSGYTGTTGSYGTGYSGVYDRNTYTTDHCAAVADLIAKVSKATAEQVVLPLESDEEKAAREQQALDREIADLGAAMGAALQKMQDLTEERKPGNIRVVVSNEEQHVARKLSVMGSAGQFYPERIKADGTLLGTWKSDGNNGEWDAIIRFAESVEWSELHPMTCKVIGVVDDGSEMTMVLGKPRVKTAASNKETVH